MDEAFNNGASGVSFFDGPDEEYLHKFKAYLDKRGFEVANNKNEYMKIVSMFVSLFVALNVCAAGHKELPAKGDLEFDGI